MSRFYSHLVDMSTTEKIMMTTRNSSLSVWTILVLILAGLIVIVTSTSECEQECGGIKREYERFRVNALKAWKEISTGNQLCAPPTRLEKQLKKERADRVEQKLDLITSKSFLRHK